MVGAGLARGCRAAGASTRTSRPRCTGRSSAATASRRSSSPPALGCTGSARASSTTAACCSSARCAIADPAGPRRPHGLVGLAMLARAPGAPDALELADEAVAACERPRVRPATCTRSRWRAHALIARRPAPGGARRLARDTRARRRPSATTRAWRSPISCSASCCTRRATSTPPATCWSARAIASAPSGDARRRLHARRSRARAALPGPADGGARGRGRRARRLPPPRGPARPRGGVRLPRSRLRAARRARASTSRRSTRRSRSPSAGASPASRQRYGARNLRSARVSRRWATSARAVGARVGEHRDGEVVEQLRRAGVAVAQPPASSSCVGVSRWKARHARLAVALEDDLRTSVPELRIHAVADEPEDRAAQVVQLAFLRQRDRRTPRTCPARTAGPRHRARAFRGSNFGCDARPRP